MQKYKMKNDVKLRLLLLTSILFGCQVVIAEWPDPKYISLFRGDSTKPGYFPFTPSGRNTGGQIGMSSETDQKVIAAIHDKQNKIYAVTQPTMEIPALNNVQKFDGVPQLLTYYYEKSV